MPSRLVSDCHPDLVPKLNRFLLECHEEKIEILVTCTYRSNAEQAELYAQGRTKPGRIVTKARPGQSKHNFTLDGRPASKAFDVVPLRYGKPVWGVKGEDGKLWERIGQIGEQFGLEWAGRWKTFREFPHFQLKEA